MIERLDTRIQWLDEHPEDPRSNVRVEKVKADLETLEWETGFPSNTAEGRHQMLLLAEANDWPVCRELGIRGTEAGWSCFLVSACTREDLRVAARAWVLR